MKHLLIALFLFVSTTLPAQPAYWRVSLTTGQYGTMHLTVRLQPRHTYLTGTTPPDAHKRILGGVKASFAKSMFQADGSLVELDSVVIDQGKVTGYLLLEKRKYWLTGTSQGDTVRALVTGKTSGKIYGRLDAVPVAAPEKPKDYVRLWQQIKGLTEQYIYNKRVLASAEWGSFCRYMDAFAPKAEDDAEFAYGFFYQAKTLPFTHYAVTGLRDTVQHYAIAGYTAPTADLRPTLKKLTANTMLLDVPAFTFRVPAVDTLMQQIVASKPDTLIIDLRQNGGGDMEGGMRICQYLTDRVLYGGVLLAQHYWNTHDAVPDTAVYKAFRLMNKANYAWFRQAVQQGVDGLCLKTEPLPRTYTGKVILLTSRNTASASEPFVYTLQQQNRATVIGEKTAGAVISMDHFYLQNLDVTIPILDYYTYDGKRLDRVGVAPTIACDPARALDVALGRVPAR